MSKLNAGRNANQYSQIDSYSGVTDASPHQLIQMLLDGAMKKIALAKGIIERGDVAKKGEVIGQAIAIVDGLRASLNLDAGEMARNLDDLYEYVGRRLLLANLNDDIEILNEVSSLLREIKTAWESIPLEAREMSSPELAAVP